MNTGNTKVYQDYFGGTLAPITASAAVGLTCSMPSTPRPSPGIAPTTWKDMRYSTGSMSFGYQPVTGVYSTMRKGTIANMGKEGSLVQPLGLFPLCRGRGQRRNLEGHPQRVCSSTRARSVMFKVKLTIKAENLARLAFFGPGALTRGFTGNNGAPLTRQEYDGYINIDGGEDNTVHMAWQVLPKKAAHVDASPLSCST